MKFIEDCRDRHLNKEIWIIGCGPSLDSFPDNFFENKITIVMNWAVIAFPHSTYWFCPRMELAAMMGHFHKSIMKKGIFLFPFPPLKNWELNEEESLKILGDYKDKVILMRWRRLDFNEKLFMKYLGETIECIARKQKCLYLGLTVLHSAIQAAVVMGTKKIVLAGCEAEYTKYPSHAQKRGMSYFYEEVLGSRYSTGELQVRLNREMLERNGTKALAMALNLLGVVIQKFYYTGGYRKIK